MNIKNLLSIQNQQGLIVTVIVAVVATTLLILAVLFVIDWRSVALQTHETEHFSIDVPKDWEWQEVEGAETGFGDLVIVEGQNHRLFVSREDLQVPVEAFMGHVSYASKGLLDSYEPLEAEAVNVAGAGPARIRLTNTVEYGEEWVLAELFAEGFDESMWYVRVGADEQHFDQLTAERILDSFRIIFVDLD